jgi:hypothetical protein
LEGRDEFVAILLVTGAPPILKSFRRMITDVGIGEQSSASGCGVLRSAIWLLILAAGFGVLPKPAIAHCANDSALGLERELEIDPTSGPLFGSHQYKERDFLRPKEVVLTFDDGPWPANTQKVLAALAHHCAKATFFVVGKHALWHPEILKEVAAAGHTIGGHSWSHPYLSRLEPKDAIGDIEKGFSAIKLALGDAMPAWPAPRSDARH